MSLSSIPRNDGSGKSDITVDYPYAAPNKRPKYFQARDENNALDSAVRFMSFLERQGHTEVRLEHDKVKQVIYVRSAKGSQL